MHSAVVAPPPQLRLEVAQSSVHVQTALREPNGARQMNKTVIAIIAAIVVIGGGYYVYDSGQKAEQVRIEAEAAALAEQEAAAKAAAEAAAQAEAEAAAQAAAEAQAQAEADAKAAEELAKAAEEAAQAAADAAAAAQTEVNNAVEAVGDALTVESLTKSVDESNLGDVEKTLLKAAIQAAGDNQDALKAIWEDFTAKTAQ